MFSERRHEGADADGAGIGEQFCHLRHSPNVLVAVRVAEAEVAAKALANVVAVQSVAHDSWK